jgi:hypothetical protein
VGSMQDSRIPRLYRIAQALFILNTVIWLLLGIVTGLKQLTENPGRLILAGILAILMFGNAAGMCLCAVFLGKRNRWLYFITLAFLTLNILLTITDQVGFLDWVTLAIDLILFGILVGIRARYTAFWYRGLSN